MITQTGTVTQITITAVILVVVVFAVVLVILGVSETFMQGVPEMSQSILKFISYRLLIDSILILSTNNQLGGKQNIYPTTRFSVRDV